MTAPRRRRSRPTLRTRIGTYWVLAIMVAAALGYIGYAFVTSPALRLHSLAVTGLVRVDRGDVLRRAAIDPQSNVWLLDRAAVRRRIEAIPYVATARVHVRPPARVWLEITERSPQACVRERGGRSYTVDGVFRVLELGCAPSLRPVFEVRARLAAMPGAFLHDPELAVLQDDAAALASLGRYRSFAHDAYGDLNAVLATGVDVEFGSDGDLERKQRLVAPILAELGPRASDVREFDLRAPATPVVEYRDPVTVPAPASRR